ncbi:hypothetical protein AB3R30_01645 [Leptolyngbyaceae cyanobacterium UHCC 1019]
MWVLNAANNALEVFSRWDAWIRVVVFPDPATAWAIVSPPDPNLLHE